MAFKNNVKKQILYTRSVIFARFSLFFFTKRRLKIWKYCTSDNYNDKCRFNVLRLKHALYRVVFVYYRFGRSNS